MLILLRRHRNRFQTFPKTFAYDPFYFRTRPFSINCHQGKKRFPVITRPWRLHKLAPKSIRLVPWLIGVRGDVVHIKMFVGKDQLMHQIESDDFVNCRFQFRF